MWIWKSQPAEHCPSSILDYGNKPNLPSLKYFQDVNKYPGACSSAYLPSTVPSISVWRIPYSLHAAFPKVFNSLQVPSPVTFLRLAFESSLCQQCWTKTTISSRKLFPLTPSFLSFLKLFFSSWAFIQEWLCPLILHSTNSPWENLCFYK